MKTRITAILLICVILSISVQAATTGGKITSVADPDRFTKSEIARSSRELKKFADDYVEGGGYISGEMQKMIMTITPARANKFFCDNKELIAACGDFLKTENGSIVVKYNSGETSDIYDYWEKKASERGWSLVTTPPEGCEVIERLRVKLSEARLIEEDNYFVVGYYPEGNSGEFKMFFRPYAESDNGLGFSSNPMKKNEKQRVYKNFYIEYDVGRGNKNAAW